MLFFLFLFAHSLTYFVSWWFPLFGIFRFCFGNGKLLYRSSSSSIYFRYIFLLSFSFQVTSYWLCSVRTIYSMFMASKTKCFSAPKTCFSYNLTWIFLLQTYYTSNWILNQFIRIFILVFDAQQRKIMKNEPKMYCIKSTMKPENVNFRDN